MEPTTDRMTSFLDELDVSGEVKTTFFMMGYCLLNVQAVEVLLKSALNVPFALQDLDSEDRANRKKTLGALLKKLRERVDIDEDLEALFVTFVESRNLFTHHLTKEFDPSTREGLIAIANFCQILAIQAREVAKFLNAAILAETPGMTFDGVDAEDVLNLVPIISAYLQRK
jgi:hypothetical protein